jgi:putative transposase
MLNSCKNSLLCDYLAGPFSDTCFCTGSVANFPWRSIWGMIGPCYPVGDDTREGAIMVSFKGAHFVRDIILTCVRRYLAYPLSYRQVEELMQERGVTVDHATINRWVLKYAPSLEEAFQHRKRPVWHMDETYIRVKGEWRYLYRAVDKTGQTIDFLLTEHRDTEAALRFLTQAIRRHGVPETITIDGSEANEAAIKRYNEEHGTHIIIRQVK